MSYDTEQFESLSALVKKCSDNGLTIYEYSYKERVFGSWSITIGTMQNRMQFSWEGKESYLTVAKSYFKELNSSPNWEPVFPQPPCRSEKIDQIYQFIWLILIEHFSI